MIIGVHTQSKLAEMSYLNIYFLLKSFIRVFCGASFDTKKFGKKWFAISMVKQLRLPDVVHVSKYQKGSDKWAMWINGDQYSSI